MSGWLFVVVIAVSLLIHGPLNLKTSLLSRDDGWLTLSLQGVHSIPDWWSLIRTGNLPDFQPVRDFSYWLDWQVAGFFGGSPYFHLTNFILWLAIVFFMWRIAESVFSSGGEPREKLQGAGLVLACGLTVLFAIHPVAVEAVAWISGRKHLLSVLFMLLATLVMLDAGKRGQLRWSHTFVVPFFYLLACLSQPINVLWPVWAYLFVTVNGSIAKSPQNRGKMLIMMVMLAIIFAMTVMLNMTVYQGKAWFGFLLTPHAEIYGRKLEGFRFDEAGLSLLALGRYFFNLLVPFKLAHRYAPGSWANLLGLLAFPIFLWLCWRSKRRMKVALWVLHAMLPLLVVTVQLSQIFVADSYGLSALPGFLLAFGTLALDGFPQLLRWRLILFALAGMMLAMSMSLARSWMSVETMWFRSNLVEETPDSVYFTGGFLVNAGKHEQAMQHAAKLMELSGLNNKSIRLMAFTLCDHPGIELPEKMDRFRQLGITETPPVMDCLAEIHRRSGRREEEAKLLLRILDEAPIYFRMELSGGQDRLVHACEAAVKQERECREAIKSLKGDGVSGR